MSAYNHKDKNILRDRDWKARWGLVGAHATQTGHNEWFYQHWIIIKEKSRKEVLRKSSLKHRQKQLRPAFCILLTLVSRVIPEAFSILAGPISFTDLSYFSSLECSFLWVVLAILLDGMRFYIIDFIFLTLLSSLSFFPLAITMAQIQAMIYVLRYTLVNVTHALRLFID